MMVSHKGLIVSEDDHIPYFWSFWGRFLDVVPNFALSIAFPPWIQTKLFCHDGAKVGG